MSNLPLLTIAIPTYNRSQHLSFLLSILEYELHDLGDKVKLLISDNASTDNTSSVIDIYSARIKNLISIKNKVNNGADENISQCYLLADTPYVWVLGDDDAPFKGMLKLILELLKNELPDMVYLPSKPTKNILIDHSNHAITKIEAVQLSRERFASTLHIQMTFISGFILRKQPELDSCIYKQLPITQGTCLIQMAWMLETLKNGSRFFICKEQQLMATTANSGGYSAFTVFMINHTRIVSEILADQPNLGRDIIRMTSWCHLPGLIWHLRHGSFGNFKMLNRKEVNLPVELTKTNGFRFLVQPIWTMSTLSAKIVFFISRIITFSVRHYHNDIIFPWQRSIKIHMDKQK